MELLELIYDGRNYHYHLSTNRQMEILGFFLTRGVGCDVQIFKAWAVANKEDPESKFSESIGANIVHLEEEDGSIFIEDTSCRDRDEIKFEASSHQFIQLLDDWDAKVCKMRPNHVLIKYENDQFSIKTKN